MSDDRGFEVVVSAGSLRSTHGVVMAHRWTPDGVVVETEFTGAHLYHLAAAGCVLNDVYRESERLGVPVDGVRVRAYGGFNTTTWASTGVLYEIELASGADDEDVARVVAVVDDVAEIPRALRAGTTVSRFISN